MHMASLYGEVDTVRELLRHVPSHLKSELPVSVQTSVIQEFANEFDLTPIHLASYSGSDDVVTIHQFINFQRIVKVFNIGESIAKFCRNRGRCSLIAFGLHSPAFGLHGRTYWGSGSTFE